jgi:hypothetical protein
MDEKKKKVRRVIISERPEWLDGAGLECHFGIGHGLAYQLLKDGAIKGVSLKRRDDQARGKRLFDCESVRKFLASRFDNGVALAK